MAGYTRQSTISTGNIILAADFNNEYNQLITAFGSSGHAHDGTTGNGPTLSLTAAVTGTLPVANGGSGATTLTDGGVLLGSGTGAITAMGVLSDGQIIVGDGTTDPVAESGATARTSLGAAASGANNDITSINSIAIPTAQYTSAEETKLSGIEASADVTDITNVNAASATTVGTIGTGVWQGTAINQTYLVGQSGTNTGDEVAADLTTAGVVELATNAESVTGTDTGRTVTPAGLRAALVDGNDTTMGKFNLKDYGEVTNAIGATGGGTQDIDLTLGNNVVATVDTNTNTFTFSNPTASDELCGFTLFLTNGGSQTVNWPGSVDWAGATAPTLTTSGLDILVFVTTDGGTIWHGMVSVADSK